MTITSYSTYNSTPNYYITCECGCFIVNRNLSKHKKTKKHLNKIRAIIYYTNECYSGI
jgi:hypothetical protein